MRTKYTSTCLVCGSQFIPSKSSKGLYCGPRCFRASFTPASSIKRFWSHVDKKGPDDCWLWMISKDRKGYGNFWTGQCQAKAHRFSWELHNGPIPDGLMVCHKCDVRYPLGDNTYRACVNPAHLFLGTALDNERDCIAKGRRTNHVGEDHPAAKLTRGEVFEIRRLHKEYLEKLARNFGISKSALLHILYRRRWKHLSGDSEQSSDGTVKGIHVPLGAPDDANI